jgi:hypothetical protein
VKQQRKEKDKTTTWIRRHNIKIKKIEQQCKEENRAKKEEGIIVMKQLESVLVWEKRKIEELKERCKFYILYKRRGRLVWDSHNQRCC